MTFARLVRFYGIDPVAFFEMPQWIKRELARHLPPIQALEEKQQIDAILHPHMTASVRRRQLRGLKRSMRALQGERIVPEPVPESERDPEMAAEYFRSLGIKVVEAG